MLIALALSILFSIAVGIFAARNKRAESIIIPLLDIFQSIPILGFFPVVILGVVAVIPGQLGVNLAVIFLIFTSMSWNIAFGVYEAVKAIPQDYVDLSNMSSVSSFSRILTLYIPSSLSRIAYNSQTSWAVGLFYLVASEIFSLGGTPIKVDRGIGVTIINFLNAHDFVGYAYSILALVVAVAIWQVVFLREFSLWAERYRFGEAPHGERRDPLMRVYSWINSRSIAKLFLLTQGRGVTGFTSSLQKFRRGIFYAVLISVIVFLGFGIAAALASARTSVQFPSAPNLLANESGILVGLGFSLVRVWYVYSLAVLGGVPLGIAIALRTRLYDVMVPVLEVVASIPAPALLPVIYVAAAGQGEVVAAVVIFLGMIWYIIFNTMAGIRSLPSEIFELKRVFHISTVKAWRDIYLPASATAFVTGSITAIGAAWNTLIIAEYFTASNGLFTQVNTGIGKIIAIATNSTPADLLTLYLAIASMTLLIVAINLTVWRRAYHYTTKRYAYNR